MGEMGQTNSLCEKLFIEIGRRRYEVADFKQASQMFCKARDVSGRGASETPDARIVTQSGRHVANISYNGRVWPVEDWHPGMLPLYDNRLSVVHANVLSAVRR